MTKERCLTPLFFFISLSILNLHPVAFAETIDKVVAIVNDDIITLTELNEAEKAFFKDTMRIIDFDVKKTGSDNIKRKILDRLIEGKLIEQEAKKRGVIVPQRDIDAAIGNILRENSISKEKLAEKLESQGSSLEKYKDHIRLEMEKMKLINHEIKAKIALNEDELKKYYNENIDSFREVKAVRVQHILILTPKDGSEDEIKKVYELAENLLTKLDKGEDFGKLAKIYSQGASKDSGGDMGWFKPEEIVQFLKTEVLNLKIGEVSNIIKSSLGFHIIKLMDKREGEGKSFEEVKDKIKKTLTIRKTEKQFNEWVKDLRKKSFVKIKL